ncbi:MAG: NUDIX hydrolase [Gammaproteobacteria bacterium]|nr:NUDIX hydrolase [Gammaproteobacteria bacterium]
MSSNVSVTTDIVIFTIRDEALKILLIRRGAKPYKGRWALPGGFLHAEEDIDDCARRELREETGVSGVYLEQLYTFGHPKRDPRGRVVTIAYYALIPSERVQLQAATDAEAVGWFSMDELPRLAFDHDAILTMAHERLVAKLNYSTIAFQFMPEQFTLSDLQAVYEIIRQEPVDKRNFRKWVLGLGHIEETGEERREGTMRPARLYRTKYRDTVAIIK